MRSRKGIVSPENGFSLSFGLVSLMMDEHSSVRYDREEVGSNPTQSANIVGYASAPPNQKKKEMGDYEKIKAIAKQIKNLWPREIVSKVTDWYKSDNSDTNPNYEELARYIVNTGMGSSYIDQLTLKEDFLNEYFYAHDYKCRVAIDYVDSQDMNLDIVFGDWDGLEMEVRKAMEILFGK